MELSFPVARNLDDPPRILGLTPTELAVSALFYALVSPLLRGVPFSAMLSFLLSFALGAVLMVLGRTYPPNHGLFWILHFLRPQVTWVSPMRLEVRRRSF